MAEGADGLVSVVLPVRNCIEFLPEAVNSILAQTYSGFELIILDDGSTDGSGECARNMALGDPRVRVETTGGRGLVHALNYGIELARGEFVARMDADDVSMPRRFERQVGFLREHPVVALVGGGALVIDVEGRPGDRLAPPAGQRAIKRALFRQGLSLIHPTIMFRRIALLESGGYRDAFRAAEDYDLWLRMVNLYAVANLSDVVIKLRKHSNNVSTRALRKSLVSCCLALAIDKLRRAGVEDVADSTPALFGLAVAEAERLVDASGLLEDIRNRMSIREALGRLVRIGPWRGPRFGSVVLRPRILFVRRRSLRLAGQLTRWLVERCQSRETV